MSQKADLSTISDGRDGPCFLLNFRRPKKWILVCFFKFRRGSWPSEMAEHPSRTFQQYIRPSLQYCCSYSVLTGRTVQTGSRNLRTVLVFTEVLLRPSVQGNYRYVSSQFGKKCPMGTFPMSDFDENDGNQSNRGVLVI